MFSLNDSLRYWLWSEPTDMRKSFYTLSGLVRTKMGKDPFDGSVYVFINARHYRIKLLHMGHEPNFATTILTCFHTLRENSCIRTRNLDVVIILM